MSITICSATLASPAEPLVLAPFGDKIVTPAPPEITITPVLPSRMGTVAPNGIPTVELLAMVTAILAVLVQRIPFLWSVRANVYALAVTVFIGNGNGGVRNVILGI